MAIPKNYPDMSTPLTAEFLLDYCHPVGEVFFTEDDDFNPNIEWGGTWEKDTDGVVYGSKSNSSSSMFNTNTGNIIGEEKHTLTIQEMPSHNHSWKWSTHSATGSGEWSSDGSGNVANDIIGNTGGGQPHNNVQRTKICNIWIRTA